jgi:hypothetical protein
VGVDVIAERFRDGIRHRRRVAGTGNRDVQVPEVHALKTLTSSDTRARQGRPPSRSKPCSHG